MKKPSPFRFVRCLTFVLALPALGISGAVSAENGALYTLPGLTPLQQSVATPLQNVCLALPPVRRPAPIRRAFSTVVRGWWPAPRLPSRTRSPA